MYLLALSRLSVLAKQLENTWRYFWEILYCWILLKSVRTFRCGFGSGTLHERLRVLLRGEGESAFGQSLHEESSSRHTPAWGGGILCTEFVTHPVRCQTLHSHEGHWHYATYVTGAICKGLIVAETCYNLHTFPNLLGYPVYFVLKMRTFTLWDLYFVFKLIYEWIAWFTLFTFYLHIACFGLTTN